MSSSATDIDMFVHDIKVEDRPIYNFNNDNDNYNADDDDNIHKKCVAYITGPSYNSTTDIVVEIDFKPYLKLKIDPNWSMNHCKLLIDKLAFITKQNVKTIDYSITYLHQTHGFIPDLKASANHDVAKKFPILTIAFLTHEALRIAGGFLFNCCKSSQKARGLTVENLCTKHMDIEPYEYNISLITMFVTKFRQIKPSCPIKIKKYNDVKALTTSTWPVSLDYKTERGRRVIQSEPKYIFNSEQEPTLNELPPPNLIEYSFDGEMFGARNLFPIPAHVNDLIVCLGASVIGSVKPIDYEHVTDPNGNKIKDAKSLIKTATDINVLRDKGYFIPFKFERTCFVLRPEFYLKAKDRYPQKRKDYNRDDASLIKDFFSMLDENKHEKREIDYMLNATKFVWCNSEIDLIMQWRKHFLITSPHIVQGHNIHGFDFDYITKKIKRFWPNYLKEYEKFGQIVDEVTPLKEYTFQSKASRKRTSYMMHMTGRLQVDTLNFFRRCGDNSLKSYSLNALSEKFLKTKKIDLKAKTLFALVRSGLLQNYMLFAAYCAKDCDLVIELMHRRSIKQSIVSMSALTCTTSRSTNDKGQQEKQYNLMAYHSNNKYFVNYRKKFKAFTANNTNINIANDDNYDSDNDGDILDQEECEKQDIDYEQQMSLLSISNATRPLKKQKKNHNNDELHKNDVKTGAKPESATADDGVEKIRGACVFNAKANYYKWPIGVLDWSSMYPMQIILNNLCSSTWLSEEEAKKLSKEDLAKYYNKIEIDQESVAAKIEGKTKEKLYAQENKFGSELGYQVKIQSLTNIIDNMNKKEQLKEATSSKVPLDQLRNAETLDDLLKIDAIKKFDPKQLSRDELGIAKVVKCYYFAKNAPSILAQLEKSLLSKRSAIRKSMKAYLAADKTRTEEDDVYTIMDSDQNSCKICCNSCYGYMAAISQGRAPCLAVAESITSGARQLIHMTKYIAENFFNAELVYGDTDSIMIFYHDIKNNTPEDRVRCMKRSMLIAKFITEVVMSSKAELTFEKVYHPWLLQRKKKYGGQMYKPKPNVPLEKLTGETHTRGLANVRRDTCELARKTVGQIIHILCSQSEEAAYKYFKEFLAKYEKREFKIDDFIVTKMLGDIKDYAKPENQIQVQVVNKIRQRSPGSEPLPGDRIPYVVCLTKNCTTIIDSTKAKSFKQMTKRATRNKKDDFTASQGEDPEYVKQNPKENYIDYVYYLDSHFRTPITDAFQFSKKYNVTVDLNNCKRLLSNWCASNYQSLTLAAKSASASSLTTTSFKNISM